MPNRTGHSPALMGYIGGVQIDTISVGDTLRANSASLNAKQAVDHPEVIDGATDWTTFQLKGIEIDGDVSLPVIAGQSFITDLIGLTERNQSDGSLLKVSKVTIQYGAGTYSLTREYKDCLCNTLEIRASAGDKVDATINFWGRTFTEFSGGGVNGPGDVRRILSWADVNLSPSGGLTGCDIKEFSISINNSLSRNYTFCQGDGYFPNNISAGKRQVSGSIGFLGPATTPTPSNPLTGQADETPNGGSMGVTIGGVSFTLNNIVYEFQSIEAQPGIITSTVNYYAHSVDGTAIE